MQAARPDIRLLCAGKDCADFTLALTLFRELGRVPFVRATLSLQGKQKAQDFTLGAPVEVKADKKSLFKGELTTLRFLKQSGKQQLTLEARDKAHRLTLALCTALYLDKSDADICKEILSRHGLGADIPPTSFKHPQLQQAATTDWDFLLSRLWANGLVPLVQDGKLSALKLDKLGSPVALRLDAQTDFVTELELRMDNRAFVASATARAWDEVAQKETKAEGGTWKPPLPGGAKPSGTAKLEALLPYTAAKGEAEALAKGMLGRARLGFLCGRARLHNHAEAEPGQGLCLKNFDGIADGLTVVWGVRLEVQAGLCILDVQFGYEFLEKMERHRFGLTNPLGAEMPLAHGLYVGKVLKLSGDTEKGGRIQVHIPLLHEAGKGLWARHAGPYAGAGRGAVFRPEKDDEVVLGFQGGNPRAPVVLGALPSKANPAPDMLEAKDEKNALKGFVSKSGLCLLFNEEDKSLQLETPGGQSLCLNDKDGAVILKDKNGNVLTMDKSGICLESGKDITLKAKGGIALTATKGIQAEGLDVKVTGKKELALESKAMAELKAGAVLTVKGAMVKIN